MTYARMEGEQTPTVHPSSCALYLACTHAYSLIIFLPHLSLKRAPTSAHKHAWTIVRLRKTYGQ